MSRMSDGGGGVTSLNTLTGAVTLAAGAGITLTPTGQTITIVSTAGGIASVTGTANQVTASTTLGAVTLSTPSTFTSPGSVTATTNFVLPVSNSGNTEGCIFQNGVRMFSAGYPGADAMALGYEAGLGNASGNFAIGYHALHLDTVGGNFACGINALAVINDGASGYNAAMATASMQSLTAGSQNVGCGRATLLYLVYGNNNVAIGDLAGSGYTGNSGVESNNICIGSAVAGTAGEANTIRIGNGVASHTQCFIGGIHGVTPGGTGIETVIIDANGQLGSVSGGGGGIGTLDGDSGTATGATVTIAGTADQITTTGDNSATVTLSVPSTFTSPGSVTATTNFVLPASSSTAGQLVQDSASLLHTQGGDPTNDFYRNIFLGKNAGNFTHSTAVNQGGDIGIGSLTLANCIGSVNIAMGYKSLYTLIGNGNEGEYTQAKNERQRPRDAFGEKVPNCKGEK